MRFAPLGLAVAMAALALAAVGETVTLDIAPVWAGHRVGFCLLTDPPNQYAAFYDAERRMTVAQRRLDSDDWTLTRLDERVGWDSHNYVTMALDDAGHLHLAGNMHVHPLRYFRSRAPHDATTLERVTQMTGSQEDRVTYPRFLRGPGGRLVFTYRDGSSGSGVEIYNVYDVETATWSRLLDAPLLDGRGEVNAYPVGPSVGPDGFWHLTWVWRETPDCATNHDVCYARSRDLVHWERSDGTAYSLPVTPDTAEVVDPVPPGGGLINGNTRIGFDQEDRVVISYHKHTGGGEGPTRVHNARREADGWRIYETGDWDYRWDFEGGGTIHFEIRVSAVSVSGGQLVQPFRHDEYGSGRWVLDPDTLVPVDTLPPAPSPYPAALRRTVSGFPGMGVQWAGDSGRSGTPGVRYVLRWESLGVNRDRARERPWPEPAMLQLVTLDNR